MGRNPGRLIGAALLAAALALGGCAGGGGGVRFDTPRVFGSYEMGVTTGPLEGDADGDGNRPRLVAGF